MKSNRLNHQRLELQQRRQEPKQQWIEEEFGYQWLEQLRRTLSRTEKTLIPLASKRADLELAAYQAGNSQLTSVITAQRDLIEAQLRQIEQQRKLSQLSASLYYAYVEGLK